MTSESKSEAPGPTKSVAPNDRGPKPSTFLKTIERGGEYEPEKDRYHLYVSYACPFAQRTLITRKLKGLEDVISVTVVAPRLGERGWEFKKAGNYPDAEDDPIFDATYLRELYVREKPDYDGKVSVPVLFDKQTKTIVNNESADILRIFNSAFNHLLPKEKAELDLYPEALRKEIEASHADIVPNINIGVYKAGFATSQEPYETAVKALFEALDRLEASLQSQKARAQGTEYFVVGSQLTESDIRLFTSIIRFDVAYHGHFKCNFRTIRDGYPVIHRWLQNLYWNRPEFKTTTDFKHIKGGYYYQAHVNPTRIVPLGPIPDIRPL